jgi:hypothetical protein
LKVPNYLLRNAGNGKFMDQSADAGSGLAVVESSRGAAFDDLDNDGDVDVVILNSNAPPSLLRNDTTPSNQWLQVELIGSQCKDAVGAKVRISLEEKQIIDEVHRGRGYQSGYGNRMTFGLGKSAKVKDIEIAWMDGSAESFGEQLGGRKIVLRQGQGVRLKDR